MILIKTNKMKKETLEEAANSYVEKDNDNRYYDDFIEGAKWRQEQYSTEEKHIGHTINEFDKTYIKGFNDGAKWQQERSYSEEEVLYLLKALQIGYYIHNERVDIDKWFEQFKKK